MQMTNAFPFFSQIKMMKAARWFLIVKSLKKKDWNKIQKVYEGKNKNGSQWKLFRFLENDITKLFEREEREYPIYMEGHMKELNFTQKKAFLAWAKKQKDEEGNKIFFPLKKNLIDPKTRIEEEVNFDSAEYCESKSSWWSH